MSTNATIGYVTKFGDIKAIRVNADGYLQHTGAILKQHYDTLDKVRDLCNYGNASHIQKTVSETVFYSRDKDESYRDNSPRFYDNIHDFIVEGSGYLYLFNAAGNWEFWNTRREHFLLGKAVTEEALSV